MPLTAYSTYLAGRETRLRLIVTLDSASWQQHAKALLALLLAVLFARS